MPTPGEPTPSITEIVQKYWPLFLTTAGGVHLTRNFLDNVDDNGQRRARRRYLPGLAMLGAGGFGHLMRTDPEMVRDALATAQSRFNQFLQPYR